MGTTSNDTKAICKSINELAKEIRWFRMLVDEIAMAELGRRALEELAYEEEQARQDPPLPRIGGSGPDLLAGGRLFQLWGLFLRKGCRNDKKEVQRTDFDAAFCTGRA